MPSASAYKAGSLLARRFPASFGTAASRLVGAGAASSPQRRRAVARNLERVYGRKLSPIEQRRKVAETFEWYARYYHESFRLPDYSAEKIDREFGYEGFGQIEEACANGQGPILALPHLGTWEWAAFWLALTPKYKVTAIVEPLEPSELFEWFVGFRESLGMNIVPLGPEAGKASVGALNRGEVLCLLADRDLQGNGIPVEFFGERTTLPAGPASLALRTGSPLLPTAVYWKDGSRWGHVMPAVDTERRGKLRADIARVTQDLAYAFEHLISAAPEQWHMLQPNWPSDFIALGEPMPEHLQALLDEDAAV
ncbi:MAG: phosphatidylinositol mannoside acyltransferase [Acidimicrobiales bacterium]|nr:phosphatidylinositol mannoside acyltransferase [Acidimicrobiales bacterium]